MNKLHFELTMDQVNIILAGLSKLPIEAGLETFTEFRSQAQNQLQHNNPGAIETNEG